MPDEYKLAADLDRAWYNFEPDMPLEPQPDGQPHPFYVSRPRNPATRLERWLLREWHQAPKYFWSGQRGCGKTTELYCLAASTAIQERYWPVHFNIRKEADVNDLDFRDVLLLIAAHLYQAYTEAHGELPAELAQELQKWMGEVQGGIKAILGGRFAVDEIGAGINIFFTNLTLRLHREPASRRLYREVVEHALSGLIEVIDGIAGVYSALGRPALILIDGLDRVPLALSRKIFCDYREIMLQPGCPIVYTVASSLFYTSEVQMLQDKSRAIFQPNVMLHEPGQPDALNPEGYGIMQEFVFRRMAPELIASDALEAAIALSGGVFREMARVMRYAIDRAVDANRQRIEDADIDGTEVEIRGEFRRFLNPDDRRILRNVERENRYDEPDKLAPLLQALAVIDYENGGSWCDVHPALRKLLAEE